MKRLFGFFIVCSFSPFSSLHAAIPEPYTIPSFPGQIVGALLPPSDPLTLWYRQPAVEWTQALPIGNGRLGAMVFGGIIEEHLQLNEATLWSGGPYDPNHPEALKALPKARELIFAGQFKEAQDWIGLHMMAKPLRQAAYQTMGSLVLMFDAFDKVTDYRRELSLDRATVSVQFSHGGVRYQRETFASPIHQVIVMRLLADQPGKINVTLRLRSPLPSKAITESHHTLVLTGQNGPAPSGPGKLTFQARVQVLPAGGHITSDGNSVTVQGADSVVFLIAAATSYKNYKDVTQNPTRLTRQTVANASKHSFASLMNAHIQEHQRLFRRVSLNLVPPILEPTDIRILKNTSVSDPQLAALYFQFGRYLLISSSRPGGQPATLQGLWNDSIKPPWGSKYTININTQMNYWLAETTNLGECHQPLFQLISELAKTGQRTAKIHYGARGWVAHHNTDGWRATAPIDGPSWGMWPMGGAWLSLHLWEHYRFTENRAFLKKAYPLLKGAALFFLDTLVPHPRQGWLVTVPSLSPENQHPYGATICAGPTMDSQILRDLFNACIKAATILQRDPELQIELKKARDRLPPNQIGAAGQLQEWLEDWDLEAPKPHHRHVSHLYGFFPSAQISLRDTPDLAAAVRKSLELRGDSATGWGLAWRLNLWARLQDSAHAHTILMNLLAPDRTYPNLLDAHPPFQIDGNFGGTAGIAEMLLQSHTETLELLPSLPKAWANGSVNGLRAPGNIEVSMKWQQGMLQSATVKKRDGGQVLLRYQNTPMELFLKPNETRVIHWGPSSSDR